GFERRDDLFFQPVREVGRVEQHEGQLVERVAGFRQLDRRLHQLGPGPSRLDDAVTLDLEPFAQQSNLGGSADTVGAFDGDNLPRIAVDWQVRNAVSVVVAWSDRALR